MSSALVQVRLVSIPPRSERVVGLVHWSRLWCMQRDQEWSWRLSELSKPDTGGGSLPKEGWGSTEKLADLVRFYPRHTFPSNRGRSVSPAEDTIFSADSESSQDRGKLAPKSLHLSLERGLVRLALYASSAWLPGGPCFQSSLHSDENLSFASSGGSTASAWLATNSLRAAFNTRRTDSEESSRDRGCPVSADE